MEKASGVLPKPWYKTPRGIALLLFLGLLSCIFLFFLGLVLRNVWVLRFGDPEEKAALEQTFNKNFTAAPNLAESSTEVTQDPNLLFRPFNQVYGQKDAPVTIYLFIDFECPFSREAYADFEKIRARYAPIGKFVFKHFPIDSIHPNAKRAALASSCAGDQGKFWEYYKLVFERQKLDEESLLAFATELKLNQNTFQNCLTTEKHRLEIEQDFSDAVNFGVRGTPTYIVNKTKIEGTFSESDWNKAILQELQKTEAPSL